MFRFVLTTICALALAGCAPSERYRVLHDDKPVRVCMTDGTGCDPIQPKTAPPRNGCPSGCVSVSDSSGAICWPANLTLPSEGCRLARCAQADCLFWECPNITMVFQDPTIEGAIESTTTSLQYDKMRLITRDDGAFECQCATTSTGKVICKDCKYEYSAVHREGPAEQPVQMSVRSPAPSTCTDKPRRVAFDGPPGEALSLSLPEGHFRRMYYYRRGQDGIQYICPFKGRKKCEEEGVPKDQNCADYSQCLEVCLDARGKVIW